MVNIEVNVGEKNIKLSIDECKELYNKLNLLFGDNDELQKFMPNIYDELFYVQPQNIPMYYDYLI